MLLIIVAMIVLTLGIPTEQTDTLKRINNENRFLTWHPISNQNKYDNLKSNLFFWYLYGLQATLKGYQEKLYACYNEHKQITRSWLSYPYYYYHPRTSNYLLFPAKSQMGYSRTQIPISGFYQNNPSWQEKNNIYLKQMGLPINIPKTVDSTKNTKTKTTNNENISKTMKPTSYHKMVTSTSQSITSEIHAASEKKPTVEFNKTQETNTTPSPENTINAAQAIAISVVTPGKEKQINNALILEEIKKCFLDYNRCKCFCKLIKDLLAARNNHNLTQN